MMSPRTLLGLPAYLYGVGCMFWCFQLGCLTGFIKWWQFSPARNDIVAAVRFLKWAFKYRVLKLGSNEVYSGKCMYLANHRSWGDFFVDMYVTGCRGVPLSRRAVGAAFPAFTTSLMALRSILLFNRLGVKDTEKFNRWLDTELAKGGPQTNLLVYPEGKRSQQTASLPLKRGMLRYAFTRKLPVQVVVTAYKEEILNERRMWTHFGRTLVTGCSEVLESSRFDDFEEFAAAVQRLWDAQWEAVFAAPRHGLPVMPEPAGPAGNYSPATCAKQTASLAFWMAVLVGGTRLMLRALAAVAAWLPGGRYLVWALVLYSVASLAAAALLPPPAARHSSTGASGAAVAGGAGGSAEARKES